jgi:hypothetical protein
VVLPGRRRIQARVVALSEGGLALVGVLDFEQGDDIRLLITPKAGRQPIKVAAIVWNEQGAARTAASSSSLRRLGCVISQPPRSFLALLDALDSRSGEETGAGGRGTIPVARSQDQDAWSNEHDLPRHRDLMPPPKPEPEELLPYFRIRMKQVGGPRTRVLTLQARSASQAEQLAHEQIESATGSGELWSVLNIARVKSPPSS